MSGRVKGRFGAWKNTGNLLRHVPWPPNRESRGEMFQPCELTLPLPAIHLFRSILPQNPAFTLSSRLALEASRLKVPVYPTEEDRVCPPGLGVSLATPTRSLEPQG